MVTKRKVGRVFDELPIAALGAPSTGFIEAVDGDPLDLTLTPGVKRLFVSFALAADSKVSVKKTRGATTVVTALKLGDTLEANKGYGPIAIPVSGLDVFDIITLSDVGFDWIIIDLSYKAEE